MKRILRRSSLWRILRPAWIELRRVLYPRGRLAYVNRLIGIRLDPECSLGSGRVEYERKHFTEFYRAIQPGDVVFDVGANQGIYAIAAAMRSGRGRNVYAFEASPAALLLLRRHAILNRVETNLMLVQAVVSAGENFLPFDAAPVAAGWAGVGKRNEQTFRLLAPSISIDRFCRANGVRPSIMKIDVEGHELEVLRGARETLSKDPAILVFCALHDEHDAELPCKVFDFMAELGYRAQGTPSAGEFVFRKSSPT